MQENNLETINKMMIMPKQFESFLCFGASMNNKEILLLKKVGVDINLLVSMIVSGLVADQELLKIMILCVGEAVKETNSQILSNV